MPAEGQAPESGQLPSKGQTPESGLPQGNNSAVNEEKPNAEQTENTSEGKDKTAEKENQSLTSYGSDTWILLGFSGVTLIAGMFSLPSCTAGTEYAR